MHKKLRLIFGIFISKLPTLPLSTLFSGFEIISWQFFSASLHCLVLWCGPWCTTVSLRWCVLRSVCSTTTAIGRFRTTEVCAVWAWVRDALPKCPHHISGCIKYLCKCDYVFVSLPVICVVLWWGVSRGHGSSLFCEAVRYWYQSVSCKKSGKWPVVAFLLCLVKHDLTAQLSFSNITTYLRYRLAKVSVGESFRRIWLAFW